MKSAGESGKAPDIALRGNIQLPVGRNDLVSGIIGTGQVFKGPCRVIKHVDPRAIVAKPGSHSVVNDVDNLAKGAALTQLL